MLHNWNQFNDDRLVQVQTPSQQVSVLAADVINLTQQAAPDQAIAALLKAMVYQIVRGDEADGEYGEFDARQVTIGIINALNSKFNQNFSS